MSHRDVSVVSRARARLRTIWDELLRLPTDEAPRFADDATAILKPLFISGSHLDVYDLIDFTVESFDELRGLSDRYNTVLEREVSGYRFVAGQLAPISNEYELAAVEDGMALGASMPGVSSHLAAALALLSDRDSPDYRNSIKESISAVEASARAATGRPKPTLGELLPVLEASGHVHPAQREAFSRLYGYTSDEGGIRHSLQDEQNVDFADAKYMLAVCSAFVAYVAQRL